MDVCPEAAFVQKIKNTATDKTAFIKSCTVTIYCQRGEICFNASTYFARRVICVLCCYATFTLLPPLALYSALLFFKQ